MNDYVDASYSFYIGSNLCVDYNVRGKDGYFNTNT